MKSRLAAVAIGLLLAITPALMAPGGGFPSRPRFAAVGINTPAANASQLAIVNDGAVRAHVRLRGVAAGAASLAYIDFEDSAGARTGYVGDGGGGDGDIQLVADIAGANIDINPGVGGQVLTNGVNITAQTGTFSAVMSDACTTDQTWTVDYQKIGNVVVMWSQQGGTPSACTSDSTSYQTAAAPIPAAIRPAGTITGPLHSGCTNNTTDSTCCLMVLSSGNLAFGRSGSGTNVCGGGSWNSAGSKQGVTGNWSITYALGNP